ncbi:hypothetical protein pb186bvf_015320 [Paramecium bursaria]
MSLQNEYKTNNIDELIQYYKQVEIQNEQAIVKYVHEGFHQHIALLLDLSKSLLDFIDGEFKFRILIHSLQNTFQLITDQLLTIIINDYETGLIIFIRNHKINEQNKLFVLKSLEDYINDKYNRAEYYKQIEVENLKVKQSKEENKEIKDNKENRESKESKEIKDEKEKSLLTIQQAVSQSMKYLRTPHKWHNQKKILIYSDFINMDVDLLSCYIILETPNDRTSDVLQFWDNQGYQYSLNGVFLGCRSLFQFNELQHISDIDRIQYYLKHYHGKLYDSKLKDSEGQAFNNIITYQSILTKYTIDRFLDLQSEGPFNVKFFKLLQYEIQDVRNIIRARIFEGFQLVYPINKKCDYVLGLKLNPRNTIYYIITGNIVEITVKCELVQFYLNNKNMKQADSYLDKYKFISKKIEERDKYYSIMCIRDQDLKYEKLVENKAFYDQNYINRYFKEMSIFFVIRQLDIMHLERDGKVISIYQYIINKVSEVAYKVYNQILIFKDEEQNTIVIKMEWFSHTILRLVCIYDKNQDLLQKIKDKIESVIRQDLLLSDSLQSFDYTLKNLLVAENYLIKINPVYHKIQLNWEWNAQYVWKLQHLFAILSTMKINAGYRLIPSRNLNNDRIYIQQFKHDQGKPIIFIQRLKLIDNKCIQIEACTEHILHVAPDGQSFRDIIINYFKQMKEQELKIIKTLYTHHMIYRFTLQNKQNFAKYTDNLILSWMEIDPDNIKQADSCLNYLELFKIRAQQEVQNYKDLQKIQDKYDYESLFQLSHKYAQIEFPNIESQTLIQRYQEIIRKFSDWSPTDSQDYMLFFSIIGLRKLLMISLEKKQIAFHLIGLDYVEKNQKAPQFLNSFYQQTLEEIIKLIKISTITAFTKKLYDLCFQNKFEQDLIIKSLKNCTQITQSLDMIDLVLQINKFLDQSLNKLNSRHSTARQSARILVDESPAKNIQVGQIKQAPLRSSSQAQAKQQIWQNILSIVEMKYRIEIITYFKQIPNSSLYYWVVQSTSEQQKDGSYEILYLKLNLRDSQFELRSFSDLVSYVEQNRASYKQRQNFYFDIEISYIDNKSVEQQKQDCLTPRRYLQQPGPLTAKFQQNLQNVSKVFQIIKLYTINQLNRFSNLTIESIDIVKQYLKDIDLKPRLIRFQQQMDVEEYKFILQIFKDELNFRKEQQKLFQFQQVRDEYFVFVMNYENINFDELENYIYEKDVLSLTEDLYIIPFWLIIEIQKEQINIYYQSDKDNKQNTDKIESETYEMINDILKVIKQQLNLYYLGMNLQIMIKPPKTLFDQEENKESMAKDQSEIQQEIQKKAILPTRVKKPTQIAKKQQNNGILDLSDLHLLGWEFFDLYQGSTKNDDLLISNLLNKSQLFSNYQCLSQKHTYFGIYNRLNCLIKFQMIKNVDQFLQKYPQVTKESIIKSNTRKGVIVYCFGTNRGDQANRELVKNFYDFIQNCQEPALLANIINSIKNQNLIQQYELEFITNSKIQHYLELNATDLQVDYYSYIIYLKQNFDRVFYRLDQIYKFPNDRSISENYSHLSGQQSLPLDQNEFTSIYCCRKTINARCQLEAIFGSGLVELKIQLFQNGYQQHWSFIKIGQKLLPEVYNKIQLFPLQLQQKENVNCNIKDTIIMLNVKIRGDVNLQMMQLYLQQTCYSSQLEYWIQYHLDYLNSLNYFDSLQQIEDLFNALPHYSFFLHHMKFGQYYDYFQWSTVLEWINNQLVIIFQKRVTKQLNWVIFSKQNNNYQIFKTFEEIKFDLNINQQPQLYFVITENQDSYEALKQVSMKKQKQSDDYVVPRGILLMIKLSHGDIELFTYNMNWDLLVSIVDEIKYLSRWSIIRNLISQKIKQEIIGASCLQQQCESYQKIYRQQKKQFNYSDLNLINQLSITISTKDNEITQTTIKTTTQVIEHFVNNVLPYESRSQKQSIQFTEVQNHLNQFYGIKQTFGQVKLNQNQDFLSTYGTSYLQKIQDSFDQTFRKNLFNFLYNVNVQQNDFPPSQIEQALEYKMSHQSQSLFLNMIPLYFVRHRKQFDNINISLTNLSQCEKAEEQQYFESQIYYQEIINDCMKECISHSIDQNYELLIDDKEKSQKYTKSQLNIRKDTGSVEFIQSGTKQTHKIGSLQNYKDKRERFLSDGTIEDFNSIEFQFFDKNDLLNYFDDFTTQELQIQEVDQEGFLKMKLRVVYLRKKSQNRSMFLKRIVLEPPFIIEQVYSVNQNEEVIQEMENKESLIYKMEKLHAKQIVKIASQPVDKIGQINQYILLKQYIHFYQKFNTSVPNINEYLLNINLGQLPTYLQINKFQHFIDNNSYLYYLEDQKQSNNKFKKFIHPVLKENYDDIYFYIEIMHEKPKIYREEIELLLNQDQEGTTILHLYLFVIINKELDQNFQLQLKSKVQHILLETLKRALINFKAQEAWNRIKNQDQLIFNIDLFNYLQSECQQTVIKKLEKEGGGFQILEEELLSKTCNLEEFMHYIQKQNPKQQIRLSQCLNIALIPDETEKVFYIIEITNKICIRIWYLYIQDPTYDQIKNMLPHNNWCTRALRDFLINQNNI